MKRKHDEIDPNDSKPYALFNFNLLLEERMKLKEMIKQGRARNLADAVGKCIQAYQL